MEEILAEARRRGVEAEFFEVSSRETSVEFENNRLKRAETVDRAGLAVRVISRGRLGFATSSLPADRVLLLEKALETAEFGKEARFSLPGAAACPAVATWDAAVAGVAPEELVATGEELIEPLRMADPKFKAGVTLTAADSKTFLANTAGFAGEMRKTAYGGSVGGILIEGENFLDLAEGFYSCRKNDRLFSLRDRVLVHLNKGRRNAPLASGKYPVLFAPTAVASLLGPIVACLNGKAVQKGTSPFRGRLGEKVFAESFTLVDDPLRPDFPASSPFDAEGIPAAPSPLVEHGSIRRFLLDLDTAAALAMPPSGNGRRGGWPSPPSPGPSTLVMQAGKASYHDMLNGIQRGLFVHHFLGAGQGNPYGGVINANILLGFVVENGEITGRVKNTMLSVNVFDLFRSNLSAVSGDTEDVWGSMVLPYVLADGVSITA